MALHCSPIAASISGLPFRCARSRTPDDPSPGVVILQEEFAAHRTGDHRVRDRELLGTNREIDVDDHQTDQPDPGRPVQDVHEPPGHVAEEIRIASEEDRLYAT